ncbi:hypothetical protein ACFWIQ_06600 [Kitasatospora sp. NPDC127059]|uniref:hypothetical protein n=1 Tax=unclassified Kitasatospora TaxID=2633591 RepID=UPI003653C4AF
MTADQRTTTPRTADERATLASFLDFQRDTPGPPEPWALNDPVFVEHLNTGLDVAILLTGLSS